MTAKKAKAMAARAFDHTPQSLFVMAILMTLCAIPAMGSVAALITAFAMILALPVAIARRGWSDGGGKRWVWGALLAYFVYFTAGDAVLQGDIGASLYTMTPNIPLVAAALIALALDPKRAFATPKQVGAWASGAVLLSFGLAALIWMTQPGWQLFGQPLTELTMVNGRLQLFAGNPLPFAAAFLTLGFVSLLGWHDRGPISRSLALAAMVTAVLTASLWSQSRGATLVALPLMGLALWYLRPRPLPLVAVALGLACVVAGILFFGGYGDRVSASLARLVVGVSAFATADATLESSTGQRIMMYHAGLSAWMESPIWGHGISQRFKAAVPHFPEGMQFGYSHLHNSFITHAVAGGAIGVALVLALVLTPFAVNRAHRPLARIDSPARRDARYFAALIFVSLAGIGMTNLILNHDVSANFLSTLLLTHLLTHQARPGASA